MPVNTEEKTVQANTENTALFEEMIRAGVIYGRKKSKTHPKMKQFLLTMRNNIGLFNLSRTAKAIEDAKRFISQIVSEGGTILVVGTQPIIRELTREFAEKNDLPYVNERWLGGTLTNFDTIQKRVKYYIKLKQDRASGALEKYTKKERLDFDREIERLDKLFKGIESMDKLPEALLIIDVNQHAIAVREAKKLNIPVVAIVNSDNNPDGVAYPIPANSSAKSSVAWIFDKLKEALDEGRKKLLANKSADSEKGNNDKE